MPRLFTGLEIPAEVAPYPFQLAWWPARRALGSIPKITHVTLRFIGDIDGISASEIASMLFRVNRKPFEVTVQGLSSFGGRKPRAWLPTIRAEPAPDRAAGGTGAADAAPSGSIREGRKFTPHVTLARLYDASSQDVADYLSVRGYFPSRVFKAERFVLFSARASTGGGPYVGRGLLSR